MDAKLSVSVLTLFPQLIDNYFTESIFGAAQEKGLVAISSVNFRDFAENKHNSVDDLPFGGGPGMVLAPQPIFDCVEKVEPPRPLIYLTPAGKPFDQKTAEELAEIGSFSLLCGRYEGVDQRVRDELIDQEISVGDFVLAGGEAAAISVIESVARLVPGVLGNVDSPEDESFSNGLLEYPQYTRPAEFRGLEVPEVLTSGNHALIEQWRREQAEQITADRRPDLLG